jgi:hypothetical protein
MRCPTCACNRFVLDRFTSAPPWAPLPSAPPTWADEVDAWVAQVVQARLLWEGTPLWRPLLARRRKAAWWALVREGYPLAPYFGGEDEDGR